MALIAMQYTPFMAKPMPTAEGFIKVSYLAEVISKYIELVRNVFKDKENILENLKGIEGVYVVLLTVYGLFLVTAGTRFKSASLGSLFLFVIYSILKNYRDYADKVARPINNFFYQFEAVKSLDIFGDPERMILGYLVVSLLILSILSVLLFWVRIAGLGILVFMVYRLYKVYIKGGENIKSSPLEFVIVAAITVIFVLLFRWVEELIIDFIICFLGSSVILGFAHGSFGFPGDYDAFYKSFFEEGKAMETVRNINFLYVVILTIACAFVQRSVYAK